MKYKILHDLQFYYQEKVILVQLNEKFITNREHIFDIEETEKYFVDVEEILTKDGKLEIVYNRPNGYTPLLDLKDYADFYKLDIVNRLLEMNVLDTNKTYLAMQNILLKDTRDLLFIYKADNYDNLPYQKNNTIDQWKNFICSFFGKFSLEKYEKNRVEILSKEKNSFLTEIEAIEDLNSLKLLIKNRLTEEQTNFFSDELLEKKTLVRQDRRKKILKTSLVIGALVLYCGTILVMKSHEKKEVAAIKKNADTEITILNKIIDNDSENIEKDMKKLNYPKKKQVDIYVKIGDYSKAFELDKKADKKIIQNLYKQGDSEKIENLDLPGSDYLTDFKKILSYKNSTDIEYLVQTSSDNTIIEALSDQAVKNKDVTTIKNIRQVSITQKELEIDPKRQIRMIDLLIENNSEELEKSYKNNSLSDEIKKKQTNDLLEENNKLLSEKIELTNNEKK